MVIYADILFVINFFITYLLLLLSALMLKRQMKTARFLFASLLGGAHSLVIFADELHFLITVAGKLVASILIVLIAFGFKELLPFLKALFVFYFSNMLLLGAITAVVLVANPKGIALNNSIVYFDITAKTLLFSALLAYLVACGLFRLYNRTTAKKEVYRITVEKGGKCFSLFAFVDSGNRLREPFSDYPVVIVDKGKISFDAERIIPYNTVGGEGMLSAFKPDKLIISNGKRQYETNRVYIAMSSVDSNEFSAIINPELLNI